MKIFLIHARRTAYGVLRSLRQSTGMRFFLADVEPTPVFRSRYVEESFLVSDITQVSDQEFVEELIELAKRMDPASGKPIVFTGKDDYLLFFARNYDRLSEYYQLSFEPNYETLHRVMDKASLNRTARETGILAPRTATCEDELAKLIDAELFPLIVKPTIKNLPELDVVKAAFRIRICDTAEAVRDAIAELDALAVPYVVQEYIPGGDDQLITVGVYSFRGELMAWSTSRKIRQFPPQLGECSFGSTFYMDDLVEDVRQLLAAIGLTGISQIEFKHYDGKYYLIEINPRVWSWHEIHSRVGVNLPVIAVEALSGNLPPEPITPFSGRRGERRWMFLWMDYAYNYKLKRNISFFALLRSFLGCSIEAFFDWRDPGPFLEHTRRTIVHIKTLSE